MTGPTSPTEGKVCSPSPLRSAMTGRPGHLPGRETEPNQRMSSVHPTRPEPRCWPLSLHHQRRPPTPPGPGTSGAPTEVSDRPVHSCRTPPAAGWCVPRRSATGSCGGVETGERPMTLGDGVFGWFWGCERVRFGAKMEDLPKHHLCFFGTRKSLPWVFSWPNGFFLGLFSSPKDQDLWKVSPPHPCWIHPSLCLHRDRRLRPAPENAVDRGYYGRPVDRPMERKDRALGRWTRVGRG